MDTGRFTYSIGFGSEILKDRGDVLIYEMKRENNDVIELECNISEKIMRIQVVIMRWIKKCKFNIVENDIIDLSDNGERWEGSSFKSLPFGYGSLYDSNNRLRYDGYMFEGKKVCFGTEFYDDGNTVEYKGNFMNNLRHGNGIMYDKEGSIVFEGFWHFGSGAFQWIIPSKCSDRSLFTDSVKELIVEDDCFCDLKRLHLRNNHILEKLVFGKGCFKRVIELIIAECSALKSVAVGENSFKGDWNHRDGSFLIHDCDKLDVLEISDNSFKYFGKCELKSFFVSSQ